MLWQEIMAWYFRPWLKHVGDETSGRGYFLHEMYMPKQIGVELLIPSLMECGGKQGVHLEKIEGRFAGRKQGLVRFRIQGLITRIQL